jgi:putative PIN family toxin of toxin-antitoxin system
MKRGSKSYSIIIDTNIWISFLIGKDLRGLQNYIDSQNIKIITCNEQLCELAKVFQKPKLKKYFTKEQITGFFELSDESSDSVNILTKTEICRDPKENYLASLALDSKADFLITGDMDLLVLCKIDETIVLKYTDFNNLRFIPS